MKRNLTFTALISALTIFISCEESHTEINELSPDYCGNMTVIYEDESFLQNNIEAKVEYYEDKASLDIMLKKVKFVPAMPVTIDVTIKGISCSRNQDGTFSISADDITPWAMGGPYEAYRVDDLSGTISDGKLSFEMIFFNVNKNTGYPTEYEGSAK